VLCFKLSKNNRQHQHVVYYQKIARFEQKIRCVQLHACSTFREPILELDFSTDFALQSAIPRF
jgi:hypothetical protein